MGQAHVPQPPDARAWQTTPSATVRGGGGANHVRRSDILWTERHVGTTAPPTSTRVGGTRSNALNVAILAAVALLTAAVPLATTPHGEPVLLPVAAVDARTIEPFMAWESGGDRAMQHADHRPAKLHLHPSTLTLSEYPTVGGGAAELVFTVTYAGDMQQSGRGSAQGPGESPFVRFDVTGSEYRDLYRVTNITSNIGSAGTDIFTPYDHEAELTRAKQGITYTIRAAVEFVSEGFIPIYARGFDGDVVTVNVAASEHTSMSYSEYVATRQDYLDHKPSTPLSYPLRGESSVPEKWRSGDSIIRHPVLSDPPAFLSNPLAESTMSTMFNTSGTVMTENATGDFVPVHGILVCVYDRSLVLGPLYDIPLFSQPNSGRWRSV